MPWLHDLDPVAFHVGRLPMTWYALMYFAGYAVALALGFARWRRGRLPVAAAAVADLYFWAMLGVILGARLGHVTFYAPHAWIADPLLVFRMWEGGMSFHGGAIGVVLATGLWARRHRVAFGDALDFLVPMAPLGIACGRLGNFVNGELWGTPTTLPWGMLFPGALAAAGVTPEALAAMTPAAAGALARHPSQLYEMLGEGVLLFAIVWWFSSRPRPRWAVSGLFALGYALLRFPLEFLRAPELAAAGFGGLTRGQWLCVPMAVVGVSMLWMAYRSVPDPFPASGSVRPRGAA
jgi:phosphatidylglycerol:prolipoprotein diacylglycerol transferase